MYEAGLEILKQHTRKKRVFFDSFMGVFFVLALIKDNSTPRLAQARKYIDIASQARSNLGTYLERVIVP